MGFGVWLAEISGLVVWAIRFLIGVKGDVLKSSVKIVGLIKLTKTIVSAQHFDTVDSIYSGFNVVLNGWIKCFLYCSTLTLDTFE